MDQENLFAEEAQEEALLSRAASIERSSERDAKSRARTTTQTGDLSEDESSPLIASRERRPTRTFHSRANDSYQKAINQPWTGAHGVGTLPWYKRPSVFWLLPAFFPFCLAFGGVIVPKTYLIIDLICQDYLSEQASRNPAFTFNPVLLGQENPQCSDSVHGPEIQSRYALFNLYFTLASGICAALVTPHFGTLSDRIGRKKVILFSSLGAFGMEVITIIVGRGAGTISVYWILLGAFIDGLCGSFTTGMALAFAYASDCVAPERRNVAFGYFHGSMFLGIAIGPVLAAQFIKLAGTVMIAFYIALGCHVFFLLFVLLLVPESLSKERQLLAREKRRLEIEKNPDQHWFTTVKRYNLFEPLWILWPTGEGSSSKLRKNLFVLAAIDTMMFGIAMGTMQIILGYLQSHFRWSAIQSSYYLSAVNVCRVFGLLVVLPVLTRVFRGPVQGRSGGHRGSDMLDINIIRGSVVLDLLGYIGYASAPSGAVMVISGMIASLGGIGSPTLQSSLTKHIPADRTGQVLGASGLLHALARVVGPLVFNLIYGLTVKIYAGIVFICLASCFVVVFILSWFLKPNVYLDEKAAVDLDDTDAADDDHQS